jgi:hypothetical protein
MKITLSRCTWVATAAALLLLAPVHAAPARVQTQYRELCKLLAVWDPNRTETSVIAEPGGAVPGRWHGLVSGLTTATITVNYSANFDPAAKAAFQAAVDIWATQISSTVPITVDANWSALGTGVLGQAGSNFVYQNFGAGTANTFYHSALANKIAGRDVDTTASDITATFNSEFTSWYFGTDSQTPFNKYDFESVVLHELGHGLGFSGSASDDGTNGSYGLGTSKNPMIYDRFVESASKQAVTNTAIFTNPSAALHNLFTSELPADHSTGIFWNGAAGITAAGGGTNRPHLDALSPYLSGSNYSHVSESTYPSGDPNSLMTRALSNGEVIHNPGPIVLGMFQDEGWSLGCSYTLSSPSALVLPAGGTFTVTVTTPAGCAWTATAPAGSFVTITAGASGTGTGTVTYTVPASSATPRTTTLTIAGIAFVVSQGPILAIDHDTLRFGATNSSGTLSNTTSGQTVAVTITGATGLAWSAAVTSSSPWLKITGGSGTGTGSFTVTVASDASLAGLTTATGTIAVTATGTSNTPKTINVILTLKAPGTTTGPTGSLDTPTANSANSGSVAVTGWAIDDIEVVRVQIQRDAHPSDPPAAVFNGKVFVGDASFVEGARPDIEGAVAAPLNYRAGWGYLMLTRGLIWDGGGPFKLYALATDKEGNTVTIGSVSITVSNAASTKPFGSIDTPGQGGSASGTYPNTGWVLTPSSTPTGGATIPASGVRVAIDGVFLAGVPSVSPRADISAGFPQFNTTQAGRGLFIDTTAYANGTHTIGWLVTDSLGAADGVGSRFFKIQNSSQVMTTASAGLAGSSTTFDDVFQAASRLSGVDTGEAVKVATGFDPRAALTTVRPDAFGRRHVAISELDRVEVRLSSDLPPKGGSRTTANDTAAGGKTRNHSWLPPSGGRYAAYQVANGQLRRLPVGSSFDPRQGTLYWQPGAGYVGDYEFVVVDQTRRDAKRLTHVVVTVGTPSLSAVSRATN